MAIIIDIISSGCAVDGLSYNIVASIETTTVDDWSVYVVRFENDGVTEMDENFVITHYNTDSFNIDIDGGSNGKYKIRVKNLTNTETHNSDLITITCITHTVTLEAIYPYFSETGSNNGSVKIYATKSDNSTTLSYRATKAGDPEVWNTAQEKTGLQGNTTYTIQARDSNNILSEVITVFIYSTPSNHTFYKRVVSDDNATEGYTNYTEYYWNTTTHETFIRDVEPLYAEYGHTWRPSYEGIDEGEIDNYCDGTTKHIITIELNGTITDDETINSIDCGYIPPSTNRKREVKRR